MGETLGAISRATAAATSHSTKAAMQAFRQPKLHFVTLPLFPAKQRGARCVHAASQMQGISVGRHGGEAVTGTWG